MGEEPAKFVSWASFCDTAFWAEINKHKLNEWKLDEAPKTIRATVGIADEVGTECRLSFGHESFDQLLAGVPGDLILFNTIEAFKKLNKTEFLQEHGLKIWKAIEEKEWLTNPASLFHFAFTAFADLKKFQYYYWLCTPAAVNYPAEIRVKKTGEIDRQQWEKILFGLSESQQQSVILLKAGELLPISQLEKEENNANIQIVISDPCPVADVPGWPVRNLLTAVARLKPSWNGVDVISFRGKTGICFRFSWNNQKTEEPLFTGWEPNSQGKLLPRFVDLKNQFDPKRLMEQSVSLNLSLIKWRLVPELKLERFENLKVLIFGAGTLGCNLARNLLAYNVKVISFVDNSFVSYSNPVRQSLAKFEDARNNRSKAETAAEALKEIYPTVDARSHHLTVPMPGHTVGSSEADEKLLQETVALIEDLISKHDVIFLALDSREARWLPTVIGSKYGKMVFSVALGFDNFVVIRHGLKSDEVDDTPSEGYTIPYSQLACYFCCDVTAPGNSTSDRTLDQQCTVSRPGLSPIASGVAVELLASILQSANPSQAPACLGEQDENASLFGTTPHQIRGFIFRFQQMTPAVRRFEKCVACGAAVAEEYEKDGWKFVKEVLNSPAYLEKVSGLDELQQSVDIVNIDFSDEDSVLSAV